MQSKRRNAITYLVTISHQHSYELITTANPLVGVGVWSIFKYIDFPPNNLNFGFASAYMPHTSPYYMSQDLLHAIGGSMNIRVIVLLLLL